MLKKILLRVLIVSMLFNIFLVNVHISALAEDIPMIVNTPTPYVNGDHVGVWGDSITYVGGNREPKPPTETYVTNLTNFYATKYPGSNIKFTMFGFPGDTTKDLVARAGRDFDTAPTINKAIIMIGTNDPVVTASADSIQFYNRLCQIVEILHGKGIAYNNITIFTPIAFDLIRVNALDYATNKAFVDNARQNVSQVSVYRGLAIQLANDKGCPCVDIWKEMSIYDKILKGNLPVSPDMPGVQVKLNANNGQIDLLHPTDLGHFIMARALLKAQGVLPTNIDSSNVTVNAANSNITGNCTAGTVTSASATSAKFSYKPNLLPFKNNRGYVAMKDLENIDAEMKNIDTLKVSGLEKGYFNVKTYMGGSTGYVSRYFSSAQLAQGISALNTEDIYREITNIHFYNAVLMSDVLWIETRHLGFTGPVDKDTGIAAANAMPISSTWTTAVKTQYINGKTKEATTRASLAASLANLSDLLTKPVTVEIKQMSVGATFNLDLDRDGIQGKNGWRYQTVDLRTDGNFTLTPYVDLIYWYDNRSWYGNAPEDLNRGRIVLPLLSSTNGCALINPGNYNDIAVTFVAPATGQIKIRTSTDRSTINDQIKEGNYNSDVNRLRIYRNDELAYPKGTNDSNGYPDGLTSTTLSAYNFPMQYLDWMVFKRGSVLNFNPLLLNVQAGDKIIFRVNKGSNAPITSRDKDGYTYGLASDNLSFYPIITYEQVDAPPSFIFNPPQFEQLSSSQLKITASAYDADVPGNTVVFIIARYDNDKIIDVKIRKKSAADSSFDVSEIVSIADCTKVKVFAWDDFHNMRTYFNNRFEWNKPVLP